MNSTRIMRMIVAVTILSGVLWSTLQAQSEATHSPGPSKTQEPQVDQKTQKRPGVTKDPIHPDVRSKLDESDDGRVYVLVTLKPLPKEGLTKEQRKAMAEDKQDKLLAKLGEGEFKVDHRFETEPRMIGHISAVGLTKVGKDTGVARVELSKIDPAVFPALAVTSNGRLRVIVTLQGMEPKKLTPEQRKPLVKEIQDRVLSHLTPTEFEVIVRLTLITLLAGNTTGRGLEELATDPEVKGVGVDVPGSHGAGGSTPQDGRTRAPALLESRAHTEALDVHQLGYSGAGVTVAVIDSGVTCNDPEIAGSCVGTPMAFGSNNNVDTVGHGTYMAAIISGVIGIAPDSGIWPLKWNPIAISNLIHAMEYAVANMHTVPNLRIMNISGGTAPLLFTSACTCNTANPNITVPFQEIMEMARSAGIIVFAASGNQGQCGWMMAPACCSAAEAVAAVYDATGGMNYGALANCNPASYPMPCSCNDAGSNLDQITCFSNRPADNNNCQILGAPGQDVVLSNGLPYPFNSPWGTSHATATASGIAALMFEKLGCPADAEQEADEVAGIMYWTGVTAASDPRCSFVDVPHSIRALDAIEQIVTECAMLADATCDGKVDIQDLILIRECWRGHGINILPGWCDCLDFPLSPPDGDVDLQDFAQFQIAFSGTAQGACCDLGLNCTDGHGRLPR